MIPLILADDFSGACDAAARTGLNATALLEPPVDIPEATLVALSSETRHSPAEHARSRIRSLAPLLGGRQLYKKIDSTLRGPWIAEVDELLLVTGYSQAIVCPAFPELGRTVRDGWLYVDGEPTQQIACPFTVRDASTEDDLARIAAEVCSSVLPVGSAGLAGHVLGRRATASKAPVRVAGPWIVLVGSGHPVSQAQLRLIEDARLPEVQINPGSYPAAIGGVFATGGETAARFLRTAEARGVSGLLELLPGVAAGRLLDGRYNGAWMITKAGGFGSPDTILRAIQRFS